MEHDYIHSLAPSDDGINDITPADIQQNPKLLDFLKTRIKEYRDKYHVLTNAILAKDVKIEHLNQEIRTSPGLTARLSISALNIVGAVCMSFDNKQVFWLGVTAVVVATLLNIFCKKIK